MVSMFSWENVLKIQCRMSITELHSPQPWYQGQRCPFSPFITPTMWGWGQERGVPIVQITDDGSQGLRGGPWGAKRLDRIALCY